MIIHGAAYFYVIMTNINYLLLLVFLLFLLLASA